jgi:hypothetical protein
MSRELASESAEPSFARAEAVAQSSPGKEILAEAGEHEGEAHDGDEHADSSTLFRGVPWTVAGDDGADDDDELDVATTAAYRPATASAASASSPSVATVASAAPTASAARRDAPYYADTGRFNRKQKRQKSGGSRPQVTTMTLGHSFKRYSIKNKNHAVLHDEPQPAAAGQDPVELQINIAATRKLVIDGKKATCILTRTVDSGAAWARLVDVIPLGANPGNARKRRASLQRRINKKAARYAPKEPSAKRLKSAREMRFKPGVDPNTGLSLTGNVASQSKSDYDHYLFRDKTAKMEGAVHHGFYNVALNLPQRGIPPVQVDIAKPDDVFFMISKPEVALYERIDPDKHPNIKAVDEKDRTVWVFGCLGKREGNDWVPDPSRRGWVPKRVVKYV